MLFAKRLINSVFCDCDSYFHSVELYSDTGFKMPDDFDLEDLTTAGRGKVWERVKSREEGVFRPPT